MRYYLGKPNGYMFHVRDENSLNSPCPTRPCRHDRRHHGNGHSRRVRSGLSSYLVLSGSTRFENVGDYVYQPTRILQSVADLVEEIKTGMPIDRKNTPARAESPRHEHIGLRHQTDIFAFHKPRPRPAMTK